MRLRLQLDRLGPGFYLAVMLAASMVAIITAIVAVVLAYQPVVSLPHSILGVGATVALLFSLLGFLAARRVTELVRALNSQVAGQAVSQASLRQLNASLEERVSERTVELGDALRALASESEERQKAEQSLMESQQRLTTIADNMPAAMLYIDRDQRFRFINKTYLQWHGLPEQAVIGRLLSEVYTDADSSGARYDEMVPYIERALDGERVVFEAHRMVNGGLRHVEMTYIPHLEHGMVAGFYALIQDISERKTAQLYFDHHASHDELTGLLNRKAFMERLTLAQARCRRNRKALAVLFLDLNKFRRINDAHGHAAGDRVLARFADILRQSVREVDTVARLGGDEFVVLVEHLASGVQDAVRIAEKIIATVDGQALEGGVVVSTSIGIALQRAPWAGTVADLLALADTAMYQSKQRGGSAWSLA